jgi:undecaprenyl diphosphate synthase
LMSLPIKFFNKKLPEFMKRNIKILISGDIENLPKGTRNAVLKAMDKTKNNTGLIVNFALNYSSRSEIIHAVTNILQDAKEQKLNLDQLDESVFDNYLYTKGLPDPDIIIRTGGEKRVSNFLMWQAADSELCFVDELFPDFKKELYIRAIEDVYQNHETTLNEWVV